MILKSDLESTSQQVKRKRITDDEIKQAEIDTQIERINTVHFKIWKKIEEWGKQTTTLSQFQCDTASTVSGRVRSNRKLSEIEINNAQKILDIVIEKAPELFYNMDELIESESRGQQNDHEITIDIIKKIVDWDKKNKALKDFEFCFMRDLAEGKKTLSDRNKFIANINLTKVKKYGFEE